MLKTERRVNMDIAEIALDILIVVAYGGILWLLEASCIMDSSVQTA
jgi:hypothetical protein